MLQAAGRIGVAVDVDQRAVELAQHDRHRIQRRIEARLHRILIDVEGDVRRHVEDDVVAVAGDRNAGALELGAKLGFLLVHVVADRAAGERADAGADQRRVARAVAAAADGHADKCTAERAEGIAPPAVFDIFCSPV